MKLVHDTWYVMENNLVELNSPYLFINIKIHIICSYNSMKMLYKGMQNEEIIYL